MFREVLFASLPSGCTQGDALESELFWFVFMFSVMNPCIMYDLCSPLTIAMCALPSIVAPRMHVTCLFLLFSACVGYAFDFYDLVLTAALSTSFSGTGVPKNEESHSKASPFVLLQYATSVGVRLRHGAVHSLNQVQGMLRCESAFQKRIHQHQPQKHRAHGEIFPCFTAVVLQCAIREKGQPCSGSGCEAMHVV